MAEMTSRTMKAAVWYNNRDIRLEEVPLGRPGPGEMVIKVHSCGICGSDVVEWYRLPRAPLVQGHELGAEVVEVGDAVEGGGRFKPGDRVFIAPKVPCGVCLTCRNGHYPQCSEIKERLPGGFAEYILVPRLLVEKGAYRLPDAVSFDHGTFIEPLACVVRAQRLAGLRGKPESHRTAEKEKQKSEKKEQGKGKEKGKTTEGGCSGTILVLGCGMSGLLHIQLAKAEGWGVAAVDIVESKLELARSYGADLVLRAEEDAAGRLIETFGRKADVVMLCTSALAAVEQAWAAVDKGGAIVFFAVPDPGKPVVIPINDYWTKEIRILTSYYCGPADIEEAMSLISAGGVEVDRLITHRVGLDEIEKGFRLVMEGAEAVKVIVRPHGVK